MGEKILMMQPLINTGRHAELEHVCVSYVCMTGGSTLRVDRFLYVLVYTCLRTTPVCRCTFSTSIDQAFTTVD